MGVSQLSAKVLLSSGNAAVLYEVRDRHGLVEGSRKSLIDNNLGQCYCKAARNGDRSHSAVLVAGVSVVVLFHCAVSDGAGPEERYRGGVMASIWDAQERVQTGVAEAEDYEALEGVKKAARREEMNQAIVGAFFLAVILIALAMV